MDAAMPARMSRLFVPTLRDAPADAELASHRLLLRAGCHQRQAVMEAMPSRRSVQPLHPSAVGCPSVLHRKDRFRRFLVLGANDRAVPFVERRKIVRSGNHLLHGCRHTVEPCQEGIQHVLPRLAHRALPLPLLAPLLAQNIEQLP